MTPASRSKKDSEIKLIKNIIRNADNKYFFFLYPNLYIGNNRENSNKNNPKIIAKYVKNKDNMYSIPAFNI